MTPALTLKELDVPFIPEVIPVKVMVWPLWTTVMVMLTVAVPSVVVVESGVAPPSALLKVMLTVSLPVFMSLPEASFACIVTLKGVPAVCGELMLDTE